MSKALTGKWKWNDIINPMDGDRHMLHYLWFRSGFTSNGQRFKAIRFAENILKYETESGLVEAGAGYSEDDYATPFEQYRVIDFGTGSEADDDSDGTFVAWFLSNVTRYGTVAEKLVQIAENEKAVYQSGYDKALEKGGYNAGFKAGKQAEYDAFWDSYQQNGNRKNYQYGAFGGVGWTDAVFKPKYPITVDLCYNMFCGCEISEVKNIDFSPATTFNQTFYLARRLAKLGTIEIPLATSATYSFCECNVLHTIEKIVVGEQCTFSDTFKKCNKLQNIVFEGVIGSDIDLHWSTELTGASIESIINHLSDTSSGKTLTLSLTAVDNAYGWYLPDGSFAGGSTSGHWSSLEASKPNWTINLV
jgi:hypothetical protein